MCICVVRRLAIVYPDTGLDKPVRITSRDMSADAINATLETGLGHVQAIVKSCVVILRRPHPNSLGS